MRFFKKNKPNQAETLSAEALSQVNGGATQSAFLRANSILNVARLEQPVAQIQSLRTLDLTRLSDGRFEGMIAH